MVERISPLSNTRFARAGHKAGSLSWQSLLSTAIEMMRVVPPRNLHRLASKYPFNGGLNKVIRDTAASPIALLGPPPSWGLAGSVPADWALLQIARAKEGKSKTSKAVKRQRGRGGGKVELEYEVSGTSGEQTRRASPPLLTHCVCACPPFIHTCVRRRTSALRSSGTSCRGIEL